MSDVINDLRPKFNMDDRSDVAAWDLMNDIQRMKFDDLMYEFVQDMIKEVRELEAQIETLEKQRLRCLNDKALRKICADALEILRKDYDGLRQTLGSETYKRVVADISRGTVRQR